MTTITDDIARYIKVGDIVYYIDIPYKVLEIGRGDNMGIDMTFFKVMYISTNNTLAYYHPCTIFKTNKIFNTILKTGGNV